MNQIGIFTMIFFVVLIIGRNELKRRESDFCKIRSQDYIGRQMKIRDVKYKSLSELQLTMQDITNNQKFIASVPANDNYLSGAYISISGSYKSLPEGYYRDYLSKKNVCGEIILADSPHSIMVVTNSNAWQRLVASSKKHLVTNLSEDYQQDHAGLIMGLLVGEDFLFSEELDENFKKLGITHVVAVSGSNFALVLGIALWPVHKIRARSRYLALIIFAFYYISLVGLANLAAFRAFVFYLVGTSQKLSGRKISKFSAFTLSIFVILIINPTAYLDIGFQLSILAWLVVSLLLSPLINSRILSKLPEFFRVEFLSAAFGSLFLIPINILYFKELNPFAPIFNLLLVPLIGVMNTFFLVLLPLLNVDFVRYFIAGLLSNFFYLTNILSEQSVVLSENNTIQTGAILVICFYLIYILKRYKNEYSTPIASRYLY